MRVEYLNTSAKISTPQPYTLSDISCTHLYGHASLTRVASRY